MRAQGSKRLGAVALLLTTSLATGCLYARSVTNTSRNATEQLLLTASIERALDRLELPPVRGVDVSLEIVTLETAAAPYLEHALRERVLEGGGRVTKPGASDLHLVLRAGAVGTISRELSFGIPPVPVPGSATTVPGVPIVSSLKQRGYTQLRLTGSDRDGMLSTSTGPVTERAVFDVLSILIFSFRTDDIYPPAKSFQKVPAGFSLD